MRKSTLISEEKILKNITFTLSFIIFFSVLNGITFQVAIPDISSEYQLLPSEVSWVMTGYILIFAVGSLIYGKLAGIYPVKNLITIGLILMNTGSLIGLMVTQYPMLLFARIMQAAGGSAIPALAMIVITRYIQSSQRGRVLGIFASTVILAAALGPVLGGFISGTFHWRYLFLISMLTITAIPFLRKFLPDDESYDSGFDSKGAVLISGGIASLLVFVTMGGWWFLFSGVVMTMWFVFHIIKTGDPFVSPHLFLNRPFRNTVITTFLSIGTVFGMLFMVPIMFRELNGLDSSYIGLAMFPGALSAVFIGIPGGKLSDRRGSNFVVYLGSGLLIAGFLLLSIVAGMGTVIISITLIVCYSGFALLQSSLPHAVSIALPRDQTGIGMGIYNLFFFISGAFSTAVIGRLLDPGSAGFCINPLNTCTQGWIYSNIFFMLAMVVTAAAQLFYFTFRREKNN
jgi:DHA2 family metal-tetracycline-proton antiporter-like MFS transporter